MTAQSPIRALAPLVRALGRSSWGGPLLRRTYVGAAEAAAAAFTCIPGVTAVLATGSVTRPEVLEPGASDIDLLLVVDVPTVDAEVTLRSRVQKVHRALHLVLPVFSDLDYVEERDLDLLSAFGTIWSMDLDQRFACVAGELSRPGHIFLRPGSEVELEHAVRSVKRWMRASPFVLDPRAPKDQKPRVLRKLLSDVLASRLGRDRLTPLPDLLREAQARDDAGLLRELPTAAGLPIELGLAAALECVDRLVTSVSADWRGTFDIETQAPRLHVTSDVRAFAEIAKQEGLTPGLIPRGSEGSGAMAIALAPRGDDPLDAVRRGARLLARSAPLTDPQLERPARPGVVPVDWLRSAALWGVAPLAGAAISGAAVWLTGEPDVLPVAPPGDAIRALARARVMDAFVRRIARRGRDAALDEDSGAGPRSLRPALAGALDRGTFRLASESMREGRKDERARVGEIRRWLEDRRSALRGQMRHPSIR